jgi:hypothetical protein
LRRRVPYRRRGEKTVEWNQERVKWWLQTGAVPSKSVEKLLVKAGILREFDIALLELSLAAGPGRAVAANPSALSPFAETQAVPKVGVKPVSRLRRIREAVKATKSPEA